MKQKTRADQISARTIDGVLSLILWILSKNPVILSYISWSYCTRTANGQTFCHKKVDVVGVVEHGNRRQWTARLKWNGLQSIQETMSFQVLTEIYFQMMDRASPVVGELTVKDTERFSAY